MSNLHSHPASPDEVITNLRAQLATERAKAADLAARLTESAQIREDVVAERDAERAAREAAERELTAFTGFNLATYQKTCVHHTDEERGAFRCPVCAGKARDSALARLADAEKERKAAKEALLEVVSANHTYQKVEGERNDLRASLLAAETDNARLRDALEHYAKGDAHAEKEEWVAASAHYDHGQKLAADALATPHPTPLLDEVRADTARLDWLEKNLCYLMYNTTGTMQPLHSPDGKGWADSRLRAAIDAALARGKGDGL